MTPQMHATAAASAHLPRPSQHAVGSVLRDVFSLTKPRITLMVVFTAATGLRLAPVDPAWPKVLLMLLTTAAVVSAANALNCYLERDVDRLMQRTAQRPLPARRLPPPSAAWLGAALATLAVPLLTWLVNPLTGVLGALALLSYVAVYTPMKRLSPLALHVGAIPGALPPVMGWTAATGSIDAPALVLFAIMFLWQLPHFIAIALFRQQDYARAGLQVLPLRWGEVAARRHAALCTAMLVAVSVAPPLLRTVGPAYLWGTALAGAAFLAIALAGLRPTAGRPWARRLFFASLIYLSIVFLLLWVG